MEITIGTIIVLAVLLFLLLPLLKLLKKPLKWALKILIHAGCGFVALWVLNFFGSVIGVNIEITWLSAIIAGVLGLPGVILLLVFQYIK